MFTVFIMFALLGTAYNQEHDRGCIYIEGHCYEECPVGTRSYSPSCTENLKSERTCNSPESIELPPVCDYSRCDCDEPYLKDTLSGKCVLIQDCPKGYY